MGLKQMLLGGTDEHDLTKLAEYQSIGGYDQVGKARAMTSDDLIAELQKANLRGRGGAGFPMGRKASLLDRKSPKPKYLVVNADESEPGAFKDREVMAKAPHRLLEGCLIAAHAIRPPFTTSSGLTPKNAGFQSTRSASLPGSTEPTCSAIPFAIAGLIVYLAT